MKKSNRCSAGFSSRGIALLWLVAAAGCGTHYGGADELRGEAACETGAEFFSATVPRPFAMRGRATFDVESYRVRGRFVLESRGDGDAVLEFSGATLLGGHREDVVVSLSGGDTLRVLDRERGRFYEGDEVREMIESGTDTPGAWLLALRRVLASGCPGIETLRPRDEGMAGTGPDGPFELRIAGGRLAAATWPDPAPGDTFRDRLEVRYRWRDGRIDGIEARLPTRGWRVRLEAD